jgi:hypothetical protein
VTADEILAKNQEGQSAFRAGLPFDVSQNSAWQQGWMDAQSFDGPERRERTVE